jgi:cysteine desulfurase
MAAALELALATREEHQRELELYRQSLLETFESGLPSGAFVVNGDPENRMPGILNVSFPGLSTETMLMNFDLAGIAAASGSACSSGSLELSHVLRAMHLPQEVSASAIRFSFGLGNNLLQIRDAGEKIVTIVNRMRNT